MSSISALNFEQHSELKINSDSPYAEFYNKNAIPVIAYEYVNCTINFPIFFTKRIDNGEFDSIALVGFSENENLIFNEKDILSTYIPMEMRRGPFYIAKSDDGHDLIAVDTANIKLSKETGEPLFYEDGTPTKLLNDINAFLSSMSQHRRVHDAFIELVTELDLFSEVDLNIKSEVMGDSKLNGLYKVDEQKLAKLADENVIKLHKFGAFPAIYAHLNSLKTIDKLLKIKHG